MEKEIRIKTPDKKMIDGILHGPISKSVIVMVHGLSSNMLEALHYNAARYFLKQGFSSFRFGLYWWHPDNRKMHECTLEIHGQDIDTVIKYLRSKGAKKIFIAGHSYGFPSILHSKDRGFDAVTSWDGSYSGSIKKFFKKFKRSKNPEGWLVDEGHYALMGDAMRREGMRFDSIKLLKNFNKPIKFITVGYKNKGNLEGANVMFRAANSPKDFAKIKGASHNFYEDGKQEQLYQETVSWFKKFV